MGSFTQPGPHSHQLSLYLQHLAEKSKSKAAVEEACNVLSWIHSSDGLVLPLVDPFIKATLEGLQQMLAKPVVRKEPITVETLEIIAQDAERSGFTASYILPAYWAFQDFFDLANS